MKAGDLVVLSRKGRATQMNWELVDNGYGIVLERQPKSKFIAVRWITKDGTVHRRSRNEPLRFYRYELKYLSKIHKKKKKTLNKS